ncbi:MAG TPA: peptide deformylase [Patescibacteria group bacterium]|nr:peptide deformylase [Patescibacteria group bacterium]
MAILEIARMGHPILTQLARPVEDPTDAAVSALVSSMLETLFSAGGVGLAAPQVKASVQLVLFEVPSHRAAAGFGVPLTVLVNPIITPLDEAIEEEFEACLSMPGLTGLVPRWRRIGYRGLGLDGKLIEREAEGFHARVVQHECDHLAGLLYPSRMRDLGSLAFKDELLRQQSAWRDNDDETEEQELRHDAAGA